MGYILLDNISIHVNGFDDFNQYNTMQLSTRKTRFYIQNSIVYVMLP